MTADHAARLRAFAANVAEDYPDFPIADELAADLRAALDELEQLRALTAGLRQEWGVRREGGTSVAPARNEEDARSRAAMYSRIHEPGCLPTLYHAVTRFVAGDWRDADTTGGSHG